jgi:WD40 repeat protein
MQKEFLDLSTNVFHSPMDVSVCSDKQKDKLVYNNMLEQEMLNFDTFFVDNKSNNRFSAEKSEQKKMRVLNFNQKKENKNGFSPFNVKNRIPDSELIKSIKKAKRIPKLPTRILDAPGVADDYYSNILDWSYDNVIGISLNNCLYLLTNKKPENEIVKLSESYINPYCSIKFSKAQPLLAAGDSDGTLNFFDLETNTNILNFKVN